MNQPVSRLRLRAGTSPLHTVVSVILTLFAAAIILFLLKEPALARFDSIVGDGIRSLRSGTLNVIAYWFDRIGSTAGYAALTVATAAVFIFRRKAWTAALTLLSVAGAYALNTLVKETVQRPRPELEQLFAADGFSFPSSNATIAVALFGFAAVAAVRVFALRTLGAVFAAAAAVLLVLLIGAFRIYAGVHYPSDIIAGYLLGASWLIIMLYLQRKLP